MSASKTLHNSVGVPQIQRYGALSVRKSCHHHHLRPRRNVFSFRGSGASRIEWLAFKGKPPRKNPHQSKTGTDLGEFLFAKWDCIMWRYRFWLLLWTSLQQNQRTQRFIVATHRPPRFFCWNKKPSTRNLPVTVVDLLGTQEQQTNLKKIKQPTTLPPKKTTNRETFKSQTYFYKKTFLKLFSRRLHIPIVHLSYFPSPGRCETHPSMGRFHQSPWLQRPEPRRRKRHAFV